MTVIAIIAAIIVLVIIALVIDSTFGKARRLKAAKAKRAAVAAKFDAQVREYQEGGKYKRDCSYIYMNKKYGI